MKSHVCLEQGFYRWSGMESAIRWTFPLVSKSEDGRVQGKMGEWGFELCVGFPQVGTTSQGINWAR